MRQDGKTHGDLVLAADAARSKLLRTAERLDQRRHDAFDIGRQLERHLRRVVVASGVLLVATAGAAAFVAYRFATLRDRRRRARWHLARSVWDHPERSLRARRQPFAVEVLRSVSLTLTTAILSAAMRARRARRQSVRGRST